MDGNRSSSAQAAFKVPKVPKKPAESSAARRPSATSGKLGTSCYAFIHTLHQSPLKFVQKIIISILRHSGSIYSILVF